MIGVIRVCSPLFLGPHSLIHSFIPVHSPVEGVSCSHGLADATTLPMNVYRGETGTKYTVDATPDDT